MAGAARGVGPGRLPRQAHPADRVVSSGQRHGQQRALCRKENGRKARRGRHGGKPAGRQQLHRRAGGRLGGTRRLHPAAGQQFAGGDQCGHVQALAVRPGQRLRARGAPGLRRDGPGGQGRCAVQDGGGPGERGAPTTGRTEFRQRQRVLSNRHRTVSGHGRH
ncbi:hypothetical protein D3C71_1535910 [compost metagenome]